jgi:ribosome modulation factor
LAALRTETVCATGEECGPFQRMDVRVSSLEKWRDVHEANNRADVQGLHKKLDDHKTWMMGVMATAILSLLGIAVTLMMQLSK